MTPQQQVELELTTYRLRSEVENLMALVVEIKIPTREMSDLDWCRDQLNRIGNSK